MAHPTHYSGTPHEVDLPNATGGPHTNATLVFTRANFSNAMFDPSGSPIQALGASLVAMSSSDRATATRYALEVVPGSFSLDSATGAGDGTICVWVKIPTYTNGDSVFWDWDSSVTETVPAVTDTYGRNAVWSHLNGPVYHLSSTTQLEDASGIESTSGTNSGATNGAASPMGAGSVEFDGSGASAISLGTGVAGGLDELFNNNNHQFSVWVYPTSAGTSNFGRIFDSGVWEVYCREPTATHCKLAFFVGWAGSVNGRWDTTNADLVFNQWNHIVGQFNDSSPTNNPTIYVNGPSVALTESQTPGAGGMSDDSADTKRIGNRGETDREFDGRIAELRLQRIQDSADWIATQYANQSNPAAFGDAVSTSNPPDGTTTITGVTVGDTQIAYTFSRTGTGETDMEYSVDGGAWTSAGQTTSPITVTGRTNKTIYSTMLRPVNGDGAGTVSNAWEAQTGPFETWANKGANLFQGGPNDSSVYRKGVWFWSAVVEDGNETRVYRQEGSTTTSVVVGAYGDNLHNNAALLVDADDYVWAFHGNHGSTTQINWNRSATPLAIDFGSGPSGAFNTNSLEMHYPTPRQLANGTYYLFANTDATARDIVYWTWTTTPGTGLPTELWQSAGGTRAYFSVHVFDNDIVVTHGEAIASSNFGTRDGFAEFWSNANSRWEDAAGNALTLPVTTATSGVKIFDAATAGANFGFWQTCAKDGTDWAILTSGHKSLTSIELFRVRYQTGTGWTQAEITDFSGGRWDGGSPKKSDRGPYAAYGIIYDDAGVEQIAEVWSTDGTGDPGTWTYLQLSNEAWAASLQQLRRIEGMTTDVAIPLTAIDATRVDNNNWTTTGIFAPFAALPNVINADFVPSASQIFQPALFGQGAISADFLASASAIFQPTLVSAGNTITADFVPSASVIFQPTLVPGPATLSADFVASQSQIFQPTLAGTGGISVDFLSSASVIYQPTLVAGNGAVNADFLASASTIFQPTLVGGTATLTANFVASGAQIFQPSLVDPDALWTEIPAVSTTWTEI